MELQANSSGAEVPDMEAIRAERDKAIALEYVRAGEPRGFMAAFLKANPQISRQTLWRILKRNTPWAREICAAEELPAPHPSTVTGP